MTTPKLPALKKTSYLVMIAILLLFNSCYSYKLATQAQTGMEAHKPVTANSYLWGLLNKPVSIQTDDCDALEINGVSVVSVKTNFGFALITVFTLGIWCPVKIQWECSKPCQPSGQL